MALTARTLSEIEKSHPDGLSSKEILEVLDRCGEPITEATLRKYVQLGLLPRSRRVGQKGKHRGSRGIYPVEVIRRVDEIRRAMTDGDTLEELARDAQTVRAKVSSVRGSVEDALKAAEQEIGTRDMERSQRSGLKAQFTEVRRAGKEWVKALDSLAANIQGAGRPMRPEVASRASVSSSKSKNGVRRTSRRGGA